MYTYFWDIETSCITCDNGEEMQVTFLSNILKMNHLNGDIVSSIFFRTIEETVNYMKDLEECTVWSHNLDYELSFLLRELGETSGTIKKDKDGYEQKGIYNEEIQNVILRDKHSPLSIILDVLPHITFRDSYALFNKGVKELGEELGLNKLDYDYKVKRLPWDKLSQHDYDYNERDNIIVAKSLWKYMCDNNFTFEQIPLTFTSFVKKKRKEYIVDNFGKKSINKFYFDRNEQLKDFDFFELQLKTYQGGLTASNINETGMIIEEGIYSIDIKSDYPFQMCDKYFPFFSSEATKKYKVGLADKVFKQATYKGFYGTFKFKNIRVKNRNYLLPISSSQLSKGFVSTDKVLFNGKLLSASDVTIPCNNVDIDTINLVYNYDNVECVELFITNKQRRLRQEEVSFLLNSFYVKETVLDKNALDYTLAKIYINSMYGVKVTSPIKSSYTIENGDIEKVEYFEYRKEQREEIYSNFINSEKMFGGSLDIFSDGCYITSYARYMLVEKMVKLVDVGCNVVYADTDSLKLYLENVEEKDFLNLINKENEKIIYRNKRNVRFKKYKNDNNVSENDFNKICNLGIWELETVDKNDNPEPIPTFITFGAKKYGYITKDKKVKTTIAGCNKLLPPIAINNLAKNEKISIEEAFKFVLTCGTQFDISASGRTTSFAEKRSREEMETMTYKGRRINQYGGIIIKDTTYTLNVTLNDSKLIGSTMVDSVLLKISLKGGVNFD